MGLLDFLKGDEEKKMSLHEVIQWLNKREKTNSKRVSKQIQGIHDKISQTAKDMEKSLDSLEESEVPNAKDRQRKMVLDNRSTYLRQARSFLEELPGKPDYKSLGRAHKEFTRVLNKFSKNTARNYYVTQTLLRKQLSPVNESLRRMEGLFQELKGLDVSKLKETDRLLERAEGIVEKREKKVSLKEKTGEMEEKLKGLKAERKELEEELGKLRNGKEYGRLEERKEELKKLAKERKKLKTRIKSLLSPIQKPLKRVKKGNMSESCKEYLDEPLSTVLKDKGLKKLKRVRRSVEKKVKGGNVKLGKKREKKTLERLSRMLNVKGLVKEYRNTEKKKEEMEKEISSSGIKEKESRIEDGLEEVEESIKESEKELSQALMEVKNIDQRVKKEVEELKERLSAFGILLGEVSK